MAVPPLRWRREHVAAACRRVRRPAGLVERTRWLFSLATLVSLLITAPAAVATQSGAAAPLIGAASAVCGLVWCQRYLSRRASLVGDVAEAGAMLLFAAAAPTPAVALGITFSATWQRAVYGSASRAAVYAVLLVGALAGSLLLWPLLPGHTGPVAAAPLLGALPTELLVFFVARHLGGSLFARERAGRQQDALTQLSLDLMGVRDRDHAYALAWKATRELCDASAGVRALGVEQRGCVVRVMGSAGSFSDLPARFVVPLGSSVADAQDGDGPVVARLRAQLDEAAGTRLHWSGHRLPELPGGWMLLGSPDRLPADTRAAVQSVNHQVALAVRNLEARQELVLAAQTDPLTGLPNRAAFAQALAEAADGDESVAVLFCDLDDFKVVNDGLGHGAGDDVLREVAVRLRAATRADDLCARHGGDEFAVLLRSRSAGADGAAPDALLPAATATAQRILRELQRPIRTGDRWATVSVSIGVATGRGPDSRDDVVRHADVAMYAAKASREHRVQVFGVELLGDLDDAGLTAELRTAAATGQLRVHYQPVVSLRPGREGRCEAVEALVRWQHPDRGLLLPGRFVPLAERCGAIADVGAFVLGHACREAALWQEVDRAVELHVNVSPLQLCEPGFTGTVAGALAGSGLAPHLLVLEITESAVADGVAQREVLEDLHRLGVQVALDDFGTGYSSLATLRSLPVDVLKIDRSFITDCDETPNGAVLRAIVGLAHGLGLRTVAEGVETATQLDRLRDLGVHAVQGFLLQPPAPAEELTAWLRAAHSRPGGQVPVARGVRSESSASASVVS